MARRSLKRNLSTIVSLIAIAVLAWYMNRHPEVPAATPTPAAADDTRPCATYREHRKVVDAGPAIPMLQDKKAAAYKVLEVIDGDTITVSKGGKDVRVRLMAMDTPERTTTRNGNIEYFGEEAYKYATSLVEASGWEVRLTYDQTTKDQYGRDLAYVWLKDGRLMNAVMVADGYAYSYTSSPKPVYVDTFLGLMRVAREQNKGLWGHCE